MENKPKVHFKKREHVIPQCFGRFTPDNLILYKDVCDECNQYFGENLELFLAKDTIEGIKRYSHGIKPKTPVKKRLRVKSKICEGEWKGTIVVERYQEPGKIGLEKVLQAGFFNKLKHEYVFFEPDQIPTREGLEQKGYDLKEHMVWLIAEDGEELDFLIDSLRNKGINISSKDDLIKQSRLGQEVKVETELTIDRVIFRGISKIALNYLL